MRKLFAIALFLAVAVSISAQMYTFEATSVRWNDDKPESTSVTLVIKDGAWITEGEHHIILLDEFEKDVTSEGNVYFGASGIDWEGDECAIALTTDMNDGLDGIMIYWSESQCFWYFGELKSEK